MLGPARVKLMGSFQRAECRAKELSCGAFEQTIDRLVSTTTAVWDGPRDERRQLSRQYTARRSWLNPGADDAIPLYDDGGPVLEPFGTGTTTMGRAGPTVRAECGTRGRQEMNGRSRFSVPEMIGLRQKRPSIRVTTGAQKRPQKSSRERQHHMTDYRMIIDSLPRSQTAHGIHAAKSRLSRCEPVGAAFFKENHRWT